MRFAVTLITDLAQLQTWKARWQALTDSVDGTLDFFASYAYTHAYLSHYAPPDWIVVAICDQGTGALQAVFPLQRFHITHEEQRFTACKALGVPYLPYIDFAIQSHSRREAITFLLNQVLRPELHIDLVFFWPLHEASMLCLTLLEDLGSHPALKVDRYPSNLHFIDSRGLDFAAFVKSRPSHTFKDAAYCLRRFHKKGTVRWVTPVDPVALHAAVRLLCLRNQSHFGAHHAYARFVDWPDFIADLTTQLVPQGRAELITLNLNDQTIAAGLSFLHKQRRIFYITDFDEAYRIYSPNKILISHLIEKSFQEGGVLCLGGGGYSYKRDWVTTVGEVKSAIVFLNPQARTVLEPHLGKAGISRMCGF